MPNTRRTARLGEKLSVLSSVCGLASVLESESGSACFRGCDSLLVSALSLDLCVSGTSFESLDPSCAMSGETDLVKLIIEADSCKSVSPIL